MPKVKKLRLSRREGLVLGGAAAVTAAVGVGSYLLGTRYPDDREEEPIRNGPIRILSGQDDTVNGQRRALIDQWNSNSSNRPAEMFELPNVSDLQYSQIHAILQANDSSVDIVNLDVPWVAEFASRGYLHLLKDVDPSGFLERPLAAGRWDEGQYALPFNTDTGMLYYRKPPEDTPPDLANGLISADEASGIVNWASLQGLMEDILKANQASATAAKFKGGIAMQLASYEGFTVNVWEYLLANETKPDAAGMIDFSDDEVVELLRTLASDLHDDATGLPSLIFGASLYHQEEESLRAFLNGDTPFLRHWPRAYRVLSCEADFAVGMVPMPGGVLGGQSLAVTEASQRKVPALELVKFLTSEESQQALFERGGFAATREDIYADADGEPTEEDSSQTPGACEGTGSLWPDVGALHSALTGQAVAEDAAAAIAGERPTVQRYTQFSRAFREFLYAKIEESPDPELDGLKPELDAALEGR